MREDVNECAAVQPAAAAPPNTLFGGRRTSLRAALLEARQHLLDLDTLSAGVERWHR